MINKDSLDSYKKKVNSKLEKSILPSKDKDYHQLMIIKYIHQGLTIIIVILVLETIISW